ncbi:MAG TPA: zinc-binding dehydrogenase [Polyangia bacterium]
MPNDQRTMRAAVLAGPRRIVMADVPVPEPRAGEVRIRLEGCGLCGSNLPPFEGRPWFTYPFEPGAPGHEGWGVIDAVSPNVRGHAPGERVAFLSGHAFADYDVAPGGSVVRLPPALAGKPFPGEPLGCALNAFRRSDVQAGHTVAVIGVGFLGAVITALARAAGARVLAVARRPFARAIAERMGAAATFALDDVGATAQQVLAATGGAGCDRVIEAVGLQAPLDLATEITRVRGRLIIAGYHQDGTRTVNLQQWNWRGLDVINAHERDPGAYVDGIHAAVDAVVTGAVDPFPLLTHTVPFTDLARAFALLEERPAGFLKAVVTW